MFCTKCGANLPDNSKFCNACGAAQVAAAPAAPDSAAQVAPPAEPVVNPAPAQAENTASKPAKKKSPLAIIIIAVVVIVAFLLGYFVIAPALTKDDDKKDDKTSSSAVVSDETNPSENNGPGALKYNKDNLSADAWKFDMLADYFTVEVAAGYCQDTDFVTQISFAMNISADFEQYSQLLTEIQGFDTRIKALNDSDIVFSYVEDGSNLSLIAQFNNLCDSDRLERVKMASEIVGITYDTTNSAFLYSTVNTQLTDGGFHK